MFVGVGLGVTVTVAVAGDRSVVPFEIDVLVVVMLKCVSGQGKRRIN